jgi:hypothetical protein
MNTVNGPATLTVLRELIADLVESDMRLPMVFKSPSAPRITSVPQAEDAGNGYMSYASALQMGMIQQDEHSDDMDMFCLSPKSKTNSDINHSVTVIVDHTHKRAILYDPYGDVNRRRIGLILLLYTSPSLSIIAGRVPPPVFVMCFLKCL